MKITYRSSQGIEELTIDKPEDFYPTVADKIAKDEQGQQHLQVEASVDDEHHVVYMVKIRGGTQCINPLEDTMPDEFKIKKRNETYLGYINADTNSYKYYRLTPGEDGNTFTADYGRCATSNHELGRSRTYLWPMDMWSAKYAEKIGKGYIDISEYILADDTTSISKSARKRKSTANSRLYEILHDQAETYAKKEVSVPINQTLVNKSKEIIEELRFYASDNDIDSFNNALCYLMLIMQRHIDTGDGTGVKKRLAASTKDFGRIIKREVNLCDAMEGALTNGSSDSDDFSEYNVDVFDATDEQQSYVIKRLSDSLKAKVKHVWRIIPTEQKKRFDDYVSKNGIKKFKSLWHGSRNENWASIIEKGLLLNPDAIITGKMFGKGIYFAPSSAKSWNYTSYQGTSWANGHSDHAFMGLYTVAYGNPLNVYSFSATNDYKRSVLNGNYNCCHAHKGSSLHADEIVFYNEASVLLSYIVEFS